MEHCRQTIAGHKKVILSGMFLLLAAVTAVLLYTGREQFTGNRLKNADAYFLDIQKMNGTDVHTLELHQGDTLQIHFETERGSLYMEIKAPDGTSVYRGNGKETTDFTVTMPENGVYTVVVEARRAKGTIHIQRKEKTT